jgi:MFS family permease
MRKLLLLASAMIFFDVAFFAAIAPLLPTYVEELGLSEAEAGILSASYAAGTLLAALPAGYVASRIGPRRTVICGLLTLGCASVVFGFSEHIVLLDGSRFVQGVAGALIWAGALTWLIVNSSDERRGAVVGSALGTAVAGALLGPVLGALAGEIGTEIVFSSVLAVTLLLSYAASRMPEHSTPQRQPLREVGRAMTSRPVLMTAAFVAVPSLMFGAIEVLVPLRMDDLGADHTLIAIGFIAGASLEGSLSPLSGQLSDRVGRRLPYVTGLSICVVAMVPIALGSTLGLVIAGLVVTSMGAGLCFSPALTMISEAADQSGLYQGYGSGVSNMAWATGQVLGGLTGGAVADLTGYAAPSLAIALLMAGTAVYAYRSMELGGEGQPAPS